jgi:hypothetical protein
MDPTPLAKQGSAPSYTSLMQELATSRLPEAATLAVIALGALILVVVAVLILRRQSKPDRKIKQSNLGLDPWKESAKRLNDSEDHSP